METKRCSRCGEEKPWREFNHDKSRPDGYFPICRKCLTEARGGVYHPSAPEGFKQCRKCEQVKPLEDFHVAQKGKCGRTSVCKKCRSRAKPKPLIEEGYKQCTTCKRVLPATRVYFKVDKRRKDGVSTMCKLCAATYTRTYYQLNTERVRAHKRQHYYTNREHNLLKHREWYQANKAHHRQTVKAWYEKNRAYVRELDRQRYMQSRDQMVEKTRQWRKDNYERYRAYNTSWIESNPDKAKAIRQGVDSRRRARLRSLQDTFTACDWLNCLEYWDFKCAVCQSEKSLDADHWIPLVDSNCPGTVPENMICLCEHCNATKQARNPMLWLIEKLGKEAAMRKLAEIENYFEYVREITTYKE